MKTIIAGSRCITDYSALLSALDGARAFKIVPTEVVSGLAEGPDTMGVCWARRQGLPVREFRAKWWTGAQYDRDAGKRRNTEMAAYAEALIAVWDGVSKGTEHMIRCAKRAGLLVYVYEVSW